jgi:hypothetical protein
MVKESAIQHLGLKFIDLGDHNRQHYSFFWGNEQPFASYLWHSPYSYGL